MREILFRAKGVDNGQWIYGYLLKNINGDCAIQQEINAVKNGWWLSCVVLPVITETVGQFTGITDKNGTEIFEGDIVKANFPYAKIGIVEFDKKRCSFYVKPIDGFAAYDKGYKMNANKLEIIGNIHENH